MVIKGEGSGGLRRVWFGSAKAFLLLDKLSAQQSS